MRYLRVSIKMTVYETDAVDVAESPKPKLKRVVGVGVVASTTQNFPILAFAGSVRDISCRQRNMRSLLVCK